MSTKQFSIPKQLVWEAWKQVKCNGGSSGIDRESIEQFELNLKGNLFKIWNRMSSGSYMPPPVKGVPIPKKTAGVRVLGVPTVGDRVAQTVAKTALEKILEKEFLPDSYGYRPGKSAHQAITVTQKRCWTYPWVLEFDIKGLFDEIPHELLLKALKHHTQCKWILLYVERWLKAPMQMVDGGIVTRSKGTPQGGCVSPVLSNLFLHYVFDKWMGRNHGDKPWCRYADDGLVHCKSEFQARDLLEDLKVRFKECGLEIHPTKTRIVYCKDANRKLSTNAPTEFRFLGFVFKSRPIFNKKLKKPFMGFYPAIGDDALKEMRRIIKFRWNIGLGVHRSLDDIAAEINPIVRGWITYYGEFYPSRLVKMANYIDRQLEKWARRKYLSLRGKYARSHEWLQSVFKENPGLFAHWQYFPVY